MSFFFCGSFQFFHPRSPEYMESSPVFIVLGAATLWFLSQRVRTADGELDGGASKDQALMVSWDPTQEPFQIVEGPNQLRGYATQGTFVFQTNPYTYYARTADGKLFETSPVQWAELSTLKAGTV
jgi:hypothetical protein